MFKFTVVWHWERFWNILETFYFKVHNGSAESFLQCFQRNMEFKAPQFCTLAIHLLIHLPEECLRFRTLETFSCFKYENTLKYLKSLNQSQKEALIHLTKKLQISSTFKSNISRSGARIDKAWKPITDSPYTTEQMQFARLQT